MLLLALACADPAPPPTEPARLRVSPGEIALGEVPLDEHVSAWLTLTNSGGEELELFELRVVDDQDRAMISVARPEESLLAPGASTEVELSFAARLVGPFEGELEVLSSLGLSPTLPLSATVRGEPVLRVRPDALDFGELAAGESAVRDLQLSNVGTDELRVGTVEAGLGESAFSLVISPEGARLGPGDSDGLLSVAFAPTRPGSYSEIFVITSNDPSAPQYAVAISGVAR